MPDIVIAALRKHRLAQLELRAKLGLGRLSDDDLPDIEAIPAMTAKDVHAAFESAAKAAKAFRSAGRA